MRLVAFLEANCLGTSAAVPSAPVFAPVKARQGRSMHAGIQDANSACWKPFLNKVAALRQDLRKQLADVNDLFFLPLLLRFIFSSCSRALSC